MAPSRKVLAAVLVVAAGGAVAMLFRKTDAPPEHPAGDVAFSEPVTRRLAGGGGASAPKQAFKVPTAATPPAAERGPTKIDLPVEYHRTFSPVGALLKPLDGAKSADAAGGDPNTPESPDAATQSHTIEDGDTLAALAQRYLGSSRRAGELYEHNRDVLDDPEILPLGRVLKIPPREPRAATPPPADNSDDDLPLVPVPKNAGQATDLRSGI